MSTDAVATQWSQAIEILKSEGTLGPGHIGILQTTGLMLVDDCYVAVVGSEFASTIVRKNYDSILAALRTVTGTQCSLEITVNTAIIPMTTPAYSTADAPVQVTPQPPAGPTPAVPHSPAAQQPATSESLPQPGASPQAGLQSGMPAGGTPPTIHLPADSPVTTPSSSRMGTPSNSPVTSASSSGGAQVSPQPVADEQWGETASSSSDLHTAVAPFLSSDLPTPSANEAVLSDADYSSSTPTPQVQGLNKRYTFDTYVQSRTNDMARAAAVAVAEFPGREYNPLFIYGGSGLGKTHLLHAIGNYAISLRPELNILFISAEEFTQDFINSLSRRRMESFKARYREVDILLIDDIQFIQDKEQTMEEFFHTFNSLYTKEKQIVITSDQKPQELRLEDRLRSRFALGMVATVYRPDFETRAAILSRHAQLKHLDIPSDVITYIAEHITANIRELEGALVRISAEASLRKSTIDLSLAEAALKDMISDEDSSPITAELIMNEAADYFSVSVEDLRSESRAGAIINARHIAMYLCRELTDLSLPRIGKAFGGRDHTTVMNAHKKIRTRLGERREVFNDVTELSGRIKQASRRRHDS